MEEMVSSFAVETNDMMMAVYLASLVRSVVALHNLIENKESRMSKTTQESEVVQDKENSSGKTEKS
jgi:26S proteasome regulatory subunit N8